MVAAIRLDERDGDAEEVAKLLRREDLFLGTIGDNVRIAAGAVVLTDIPDNCTAVGIPARVVRKNGFRVGELDQIHVPDPVAQELQRLREEVESLKKNRKKEGENHEDL